MALQSEAVRLRGSSKLRITLQTSRVEMTTITRVPGTEEGLLEVDSSRRHYKQQSLLMRTVPRQTEAVRTELRASTACRLRRTNSTVGTVSFQELRSSSSTVAVVAAAHLLTSSSLQHPTVVFRAMTMLLLRKVTPRSQVGTKLRISTSSSLLSSSSSTRPLHSSSEAAVVAEEGTVSTTTSRK